MRRKLLAVLLAVAMVLSSLSVTAFASENVIDQTQAVTDTAIEDEPIDGPGFDPVFSDGVIVDKDELYCGCCHSHRHNTDTLVGMIQCLVCRVTLIIKSIKWKRPAEKNVVHKYYLASSFPGNCIQQASYVYMCAVCGKEQVVRTELGDHKIKCIPGFPATCTEPGLTDCKKCYFCGLVFEEAKAIAPLGHNYCVESVTPATCTEDGFTTYTCTNCGDTYKEDIVKALGHNEEVLAAVESNCTETGLTEGKRCSVCGEILIAQQEVAALGHELVHHEGKEATDEESGWKEYDTCTRCDYTTYEIIPKHEHTLAYVDGKEATCTEKGWKAYSYCVDEKCDFTTYEEIPALGHNPITDAVVEPTCTETGLTEGSHCGRCGEVIVAQETLPANGHTEVSIKGVEPTCTDEGLTDEIKCSVCGVVITASAPISPLGHHWVKNPAVIAQSFTEPGKTEGELCDRCGEVKVAQKDVYSVAKIGDTYYLTLESALAAAKSGDTVYVGRDCTLTESAVVPAGVTLLLPCMDNDIGWQASGDGAGFSPSLQSGTPHLYRQVSVANCATLTVNGTVIVNAQVGGDTSTWGIRGGYAQLNLEGNLVVNNGGLLDCSGYIKGAGDVTLNDGAKMYETYAVVNFNGGTFTVGASRSSANGAYPFPENQMNNCRAKLRINSGASLFGSVRIYASSKFNYTRFEQIGKDSGIYRLKNSNSYCIRTIEGAKDVYKFYGGMIFGTGAMTIKVSFITANVNTEDYYFMVDGDMRFELYDGDYICNNTFEFMPGFEMIVGKNANLQLNDGAGFLFAGQGFYTAQSTLNLKKYTAGRPDAVLRVNDGGSLTAVSGASIAGVVRTQDGATVNVDSANKEITTRVVVYVKNIFSNPTVVNYKETYKLNP